MSLRAVLLITLPALAPFTPAAATAGALLSPSDTGRSFSSPPREVVYCQEPDYSMIYQMSSGFDAEIADDIPNEYAGLDLAEVILWLGEWYSIGGPDWQDPVGIRLNLYHESCPPELDPFRTVEIAWEDLEKTHVYQGAGSDVYEVRVPLSPSLVVETGMSLGATAMIDWGQEEPATGIVATPFFVSYGACPAHLDADFWGYPRWTSIDFYTGILQDLAYCLSGSTTETHELPAVETGVEAGNKGMEAAPNPFIFSTTIRFSLTRPGHVTLRVLDVIGREAMTLVDEWREAGAHAIGWDGSDEQGGALPSGVYWATIQSSERREVLQLVLLD